MMVIITRLEPGRAAVVSPPDQPDEGGSGRIPAATRRACVKRSIETIRTSCSTRSTPHARTRHMTPGAPLRAHRRRRRDSHTACSRARARWRPSYVLVLVSIATAIPVGEIASESMSPPPATAANAAAASPPPPAARAHAGRLPRARPDPTPTSEREPVARAETQPDGRESQQPAERRRSCDRNRQPEQPGDDASQCRLPGVREPAILLATRVVHAATASSSWPPPNTLPLSVG
jgi:hypothetical protein